MCFNPSRRPMLKYGVVDRMWGSHYLIESWPITIRRPDLCNESCIILAESPIVFDQVL